MVGITGVWREKVGRLSAMDDQAIASKLNKLRNQFRIQLDKEGDDSVSVLSELVPHFIRLHSHRFAPLRRFIVQILSDIGMKHMEFTPQIVPVLITLLKDETPAVARQAIRCGIDLFRSTLVKVAVQGLYSSDSESSLESSWACVQKFREEIYSVAFEPRSDGTRLLALKFVEALLLLYTPDPCGPSEPPSYQDTRGIMEFNISWVRGSNPLFDAGDLRIEARQSLGLLLDQLRVPTSSNSLIIVLINSLSVIATKRPSFYGHILPVLLGLDKSSSTDKGICGLGVQYALKKAFLSCLESEHPSAAPWRDRIVDALAEMKVEGFSERRKINQINGNIELKAISPITLEEKSSKIGGDIANIDARKKRSGSPDSSDLAKDNNLSSKRTKASHIVVKSEQGTKQIAIKEDENNEHVQQLIAMFATLISQGANAIGSLEILIASISADLLAEVVMANMRNIPLNFSRAEWDEAPLGKGPASIGRDAKLKQLLSILDEMVPTPDTSSPMDSTPDVQPTTISDIEVTEAEEVESVKLADYSKPSVPVEFGGDKSSVPLSHSSSDEVLSAKNPDVGFVESGIPGLDSSEHGNIPVKPNEESNEEQISTGNKCEDFSQGQNSNLSAGQLEAANSMSTERSEELSSVTSSAATSKLSVPPIVIPRMSVPVINLVEEEKDKIQIMVFGRIIEAYKQIADGGGSHLHSTLLSYLAVEFPLELDPWKVLQEHILLDYVNHEGHELTLRVLYRLFREAEEERDFFSSTAATSIYDTFLLTVAETLRDSFPASDKSLNRLLGDAPYLPKSLFKLLEDLCSCGDRVTQGLSVVWGLILLRPPIRDTCLKIAMQSAVHHLEEVHMKAIRLVANKLFPLSSISPQIEEFAKEMLYSVSTQEKTMGRVDDDKSELQKDMDVDNSSSGQQSGIGDVKVQSSDASRSSLAEAQRCMSLYFALCTKKHSLFRELFFVYKSAPDTVKQAIHHQIPRLVRTIGSSSEFLEILSDPPIGVENLLMQVLHTLTDGTIPSPELVQTVRNLFDTKIKDVELLTPILSYMPKDEVLRIFPHLVNLPSNKFQAAVSQLLQGSSLPDQELSAAEILIAIHGIDPNRDGIPLKKVTDACNICFEQRQIFTQQVLAKVLNQLVEQIPLPLLFMRTVLQTIGAFPALVDFILEILSRLVNKQIWKYPKLWVGFLKCVQLTKPQSFGVLLQLPPAQLENALHRVAALKQPLITHASQPNIESSLPRSILAVLGIAPETQISSQAQTAPTQTGETENSDKEINAEISKDSSTAS